MTIWAERRLRPEAWLFVPLQSVFLLCLRLWLAWVFFRSGLVKVQSLDATLALFEYEYAVPVLSPVIAAWLAIVAELLLPPLLALGLATRPVALLLLLFNVVAMQSYPDISPAGIKEHQLWGLGFATLLLFGGGRLEVVHFWRRVRPVTATPISKPTPACVPERPQQ